MLDFTLDRKNNRLIIFVHGLIGSRKTWIRLDNTKTIYDYISSDKIISDNFDLAIFEYDTRMTDFWQRNKWFLSFLFKKVRLRKSLPIEDIALLLASQVDINCRDYEEIVVVAHSMGGLITKSFILDSFAKTQKCKVSIFFSIAVPHRGSNLATLGKILLSSKQVIGLGPLSSIINTMHDDWNNQGERIPKTFFYRGLNDEIVTKDAAVAIQQGNVNIINCDDDHFSILTPLNSSHVVVTSIRNECLNLIRNLDKNDSLRIKPKKIFSLKERSANVVTKFFKEKNHKLQECIFDELEDLEFFSFNMKFKGSQVENFDELFFHVEKASLNVIHGIGGLGKSILLKRLTEEFSLQSPDSCIVYMDAKKWNERYKDFLNKTSSIEKRFEKLLFGFKANYSFDELSNYKCIGFSDNFEKIIVLDGFNEISDLNTRNEIIDLLSEVHQNWKFKVLMTSRYYNKQEFIDWNIFELQNLRPHALEILTKKYFQKSLDVYDSQNIDCLSIPYFLNIAIKDRNDSIITYSKYILNHILKGVAPENRNNTLNALSELAYTSILSEQKFVIKKDILGQKTIEYLISNQILTLSGDAYRFEHHLVNEFLVAYRIANDTTLWNRETFDIITLQNRTSFEIIRMILEQIHTEEAGDQFLLAVYDWNFYAVLYCFSKVDNKYSSEFASFIILALTEKTFDKFKHTRLKARKYLEQLYDKFNLKGKDFLLIEIENPQNHQDIILKFNKVLGANAEKFVTEPYKKWFYVLYDYTSAIIDTLIAHIATDNPVMGWCYSNMIKRSELNRIHEDKLLNMFVNEANPIIRWRIIHILGNSFSPVTINLLLDVLENENYVWLKYGAIRSILEIAIFNLQIEEAVELIQSVVNLFNSNDFENVIIDEFKSCMETEINTKKIDLLNNIIKSGLRQSNYDRHQS
ncbi:MAG: HEAT repeat domain-containing protein [Taibaiella sp.]|jgi:hypothetical protein